FSRTTRRIQRENLTAVNVATHLNHDAPVNSDWRRSRTAEHLARIDCFRKIAGPEQPTSRSVPNVQNCRDPKREQAIADDERRRVWSLRHLNRVLVLLKIGLILLLPNNLAISQIDRGDDFLRIASTVNKNTAPGDNWRRIAFANFDTPCAAESFRPILRDVFAGNRSVTRRAAPLRPFLSTNGYC